MTFSVSFLPLDCPEWVKWHYVIYQYCIEYITLFHKVTKWSMYFCKYLIWPRSKSEKSPLLSLSQGNILLLFLTFSLNWKECIFPSITKCCIPVNQLFHNIAVISEPILLVIFLKMFFIFIVGVKIKIPNCQLTLVSLYICQSP